MNDVYLISGLGADRRVYDFLDLSSFNIHHVEWIEPQRMNQFNPIVKD